MISTALFLLSFWRRECVSQILDRLFEKIKDEGLTLWSQAGREPTLTAETSINTAWYRLPEGGKGWDRGFLVRSVWYSATWVHRL